MSTFIPNTNPHLHAVLVNNYLEHTNNPDEPIDARRRPIIGWKIYEETDEGEGIAAPLPVIPGVEKVTRFDAVLIVDEVSRHCWNMMDDGDDADSVDDMLASLRKRWEADARRSPAEKALTRLFEKRGVNTVMGVLAQFGVKRLPELDEARHAELIAKCEAFTI